MGRGGQQEEEVEKRFSVCVRKYEKIVKQFDELVEVMTAITKPPKKRQRASSNLAGRSAARPTSSSQPNDNEVLVQTITRFLHELKAEP